MTESDIPDKKVVLVINASLDKGASANRAAVLATGLAAHVPNLIGQNSTTKDGKTLLSFTQMPIPILASRPETSFVDLAKKAESLGCLIIVFLARAQGMRSYEEYRQVITTLQSDELDIDAIALYGDRVSVTKLTGNLPSLR